MIEFVVNWAISVLGKTGYYGIAIMMALESACIPIPSEAILPFGGYLASAANHSNQLNIFLVIIFGSLGGTLGSLIAFLIGSYGGRPVIDKIMKRSKHSNLRLEKSYQLFDHYGEKIVFYSRLVPIIRTFISLPAGISKMNIFKFTVYTFWGSLIWSIILSTAGFFLGQNWEYIRSWLHTVDYLVVVFVICLIVYLVIKRRKTSNFVNRFL